MSLKGYTYRIYPNKKQTELLNQMLGNARFVYNWALDRRIKAYEKDKKKLSAFTLMKELAKLKKKPEYEWLNLSVAQSFNLPQMLMGQIAQNRCYMKCGKL